MVEWQVPSYALLQLVTAGIATLVSYFAWQRRDNPANQTLAYLMLAIAFWGITNTLEALSVGKSWKIIWSKISYLPAHSVSPLFLIFVWRYVPRDRDTNRAKFILLWPVPLLIIGLAATNELHGLIWSHFTWQPGNANILIYQYGIGFWIGVTYAYLLLFTAISYLISAATDLQKQFRRRVTTLLIAAFFPWVGNLLYITKFNPFPGRD